MKVKISEEPARKRVSFSFSKDEVLAALKMYAAREKGEVIPTATAFGRPILIVWDNMTDMYEPSWRAEVLVDVEPSAG